MFFSRHDTSISNLDIDPVPERGIKKSPKSDEVVSVCFKQIVEHVRVDGLV